MDDVGDAMSEAFEELHPAGGTTAAGATLGAGCTEGTVEFVGWDGGELCCCDGSSFETNFRGIGGGGTDIRLFTGSCFKKL
jgi:hypothetical protein